MKKFSDSVLDIEWLLVKETGKIVKKVLSLKSQAVGKAGDVGKDGAGQA